MCPKGAKTLYEGFKLCSSLFAPIFTITKTSFSTIDIFRILHAQGDTTINYSHADGTWHGDSEFHQDRKNNTHP
jgi:hypothetical protein